MLAHVAVDNGVDNRLRPSQIAGSTGCTTDVDKSIARKLGANSASMFPSGPVVILSVGSHT